VLSWKFDSEGNSTPMTIAEQRSEQVTPITITATNSLPVTILQKEVNISHKTLGCYKAIDGNEQD
jgi:hypothetical protein